MRLALLLVALTLSACGNRVVSDTPWFSAADAQGAPRLKDGLWEIVVDPKCRFDRTRPLERWRRCGSAVVVRGDQILELSKSTTGDGGRPQAGYQWEADPYLLAGGAPMILQRPCGLMLKKKVDAVPASEAIAEPSAAPQASVAGTPADAPDPADADADEGGQSCYTALRPSAFDAEGRIVAATIWPVQCGPRPRDRKGEPVGNVTDAPFPGLTIDGDFCVAESVAALRAAAAASERLEFVYPVRWIRDGYR